MSRTKLLLLLVSCLALLAGACGDDDDEVAAPAAEAEVGGAGAITVFAAASLTDAFTDLGEAFTGGDVRFNFGSSSALREQVLAGAPADVFASANTANLDQLVDAGEASGGRVFARNRLEVVVPKGNPARIRGLRDFARDDLLLGLCAAEVPCGQFAREALGRLGVEPAVDTNATDVRALLTQVASGDLDAGVVYRTDVLAAGGEVEGVAVPAAENVVAEYPVAVLERADEPDLARAFVDFVLSDEGRRILDAHGFDLP